MPIISLSLNNEMLIKVDALQTDLGFSGRSEIFRTAIRDFVAEHSALDDISGDVQGIILIIYDEKQGSEVSKIWHDYKDCIKSQVHNCLKNEKCLQMLIVESDAEPLKKLMANLKASKKIDIAKIFIS